MLVIVYFVIVWAFTSAFAQAGDNCSKSYEEQWLEKMLRMEINNDFFQKHVSKDIGEFKDSQTADRTVVVDELQRLSLEMMSLRTTVTEQKNAMKNNAEKIEEVVLKQTQLQDELELIDSTQTPLVAFNAYGLTSETLYANVGTTIKFQHILINEGRGYNTATGVFTAPVAGMYQFTVHFCNRGTSSAVLAIVHNGVANALSTVSDKDWIDCGSFNTLIIVRQGDSVHVESPYPNTALFENHYRRTSFLGYLIHK